MSEGVENHVDRADRIPGLIIRQRTQRQGQDFGTQQVVPIALELQAFQSYWQPSKVHRLGPALTVGMRRAGLPNTETPAPTDFVTTLPIPMLACAPMRTPSRMKQPIAMVAPVSIRATPAIQVPVDTQTSSPSSVLCPMLQRFPRMQPLPIVVVVSMPRAMTEPAPKLVVSPIITPATCGKL